MKKIKFLLFMLLISLLILPVNIYGEELAPTKTSLSMEPANKNFTADLYDGNLNIYTRGYHYLIDDSNSCTSKIEIKESKNGLLKKGDKIYLKLDNMNLNNAVIKNTLGDLVLNTSVENNMIVLSVKKESTIDSYIIIEISAEYNSSLIKNIMGKAFEYKEKLFISTDNNLPYNVFSDYSQNILVTESIFILEKCDPYNLPEIEKSISTKTGEVYFNTQGGTGITVGSYIYPKSIIISEKSAGALKESSEFYLYVKDMLFMEPLIIKTSGDIDFDYNITDDGKLFFKINKNSTTPSKITISNIILKRRSIENYELRKTYYFPLMYSTGLENPKIINECFCVIRQENEEQQTPSGDNPIIFESSKWITETEMTNNFSYRLSAENIISINSVGGRIPFWADICQPKEIIISEEKAGDLKENKSIYFKVGNLKFNDLFTVSIDGDIKADCSVDENGIMKVTVLSPSTLPSKIKIVNIAVEMGDAVILKPNISYSNYTYNYPLMIISGQYKDNLFSKSNGNIVINNRFAVQQERYTEAEYSPFAFDRIVINSNFLLVNSKKYNLENKCYLKNGRLMVPLREVTNKIFNADIDFFKYNGDENTVEIYWGLRKVKIYTKENYMTINDNKIALYSSLDINNGTSYISFRDWVNIFSGENGYIFYWDNDTNTLFFREKQQ